MQKRFSWLLLGAIAALATGCGSSRDVEVSGEVSAPATLTLSGDTYIEFFDLTGEGEELERSSVHDVRISGTGAFNETISAEGDQIIVRAIDDANGDGKCSAGEAWAEAQAPVSEDDTAAGISLQLAAKPCPGE